MSEDIKISDTQEKIEEAESDDSVSLGIKPQAIATCVWLSALGAAFITYILAFAVLVIEKNAWLKKQMIQILIVFSVFKVINRLVIEELINRVLVILDVNYDFRSWCIIAIYVIEDILLIMLAHRAWKSKASSGIPALEKMYVKCLDEDTVKEEISAMKVCPKCGKPYDDDMVFCMGCGTKLR